MCGRVFALRGTVSQIRAMFPTDIANALVEQLLHEYEHGDFDKFRRTIPWPTSFNVKPTQEVVTLFPNGDKDVTAKMVKWGHNPRGEGPPLFNARSETIAEKPTWKEPWEKGQRCIVLTGGFYEWANKQPHAVYNADDTPAYFAAIWRDDDVEWCSILTTAASEWFCRYHDREPVMLRGEDWKRWLYDDTPPTDLLEASNPDTLRVFACEPPSPDAEPVATKQQSLF